MGMPGDMMTLGCCILLPSWQEVSVFLGTAREEQPARTGRGSRPLMDRRPWGGRFWSQRMGAESLKCGVAGGPRNLRGHDVGGEGAVRKLRFGVRWRAKALSHSRS